MISAIISRIVILLFGTLYPAYASYKAVKTKNVKEYVKWMMYWIVFAFFTCLETFTDIFLAWFPFYYEIKVILVIWLLSPATKGSSTLYRKFVHPMLTRREQEIDEYISQAKEKGYTAVLQLGSKGVNYATNVIMQTAIKAFHKSQLDLALMPPPPQTAGRRSVDRHDGPMHRAYSIDSALNAVADAEEEHVLINGYDNIIYEVESEAEAQDFLAGGVDYDSDGSSARLRVVTRRKTQRKTAARKQSGAAPRARRGLRKESMDVDVVNDI